MLWVMDHLLGLRGVHACVIVQVRSSISINASGPVLAGEATHDTARLVGGASPTGTISFVVAEK
jgi:hypothetical protein